LIGLLLALKPTENEDFCESPFELEAWEDKRRKRLEMTKKIQKQKDKHERIFRKILSDKNTMNDCTFFTKMDAPEQKKIIKELREINRITRIEKPYRLTLLESNIPTVFKAVAMKKVSSLKNYSIRCQMTTTFEWRLTCVVIRLL
jgi:hypothetical protein